MKLAKDLLCIDGKETAYCIEKYIQDAVMEHKANGVIMGLSGGVDSALLAALAVRALGKDRVVVYFLHDKNSEKDSMDKARLTAEWLGLKLNMGSITEEMRKKEKKAHFFKFLSKLPSSFIPIVSSLYYMIVGESPYITTLRKAEYSNNKFKKWVYDHIVAGVEEMFDGPCELRRVILERIGREKNLLLIGAGNKSEDMTGWFTIKGIDNMPVSPIKDLFKVQVRQLAGCLGVPEAILKRKPTADVLKGANDALALGMNFDKIDIVLCGIEKGMTDNMLKDYGLIESEIKKVRNIHRLSEWKRRQPQN